MTRNEKTVLEYTVTLKPSNKQFITHNKCTILEAAKQARIILSHSCRDGSCGKCKSRLITGKVEHPNEIDGISEKELVEGYILTCIAKPASDIEIESRYFPELNNIVPVLTPCKVDSLTFPSPDIAIMILRLPYDMEFKYLPGQYIGLIWKGIRRSYSIANADHGEHRIELHVRRIEGGILSQIIFSGLKIGSLMHIHGPHGTFFIRDTKLPIIFLAGGTGFAPIKSMIEKLLDQKTSRMIYIYWGISSIDLLYLSEPDEWQSSQDNVQFTPVLSSDDVSWIGRKGLVHRAVLQDFTNLESYEVYACGSSNMIKSIKNDLLKQGLLKNNFFTDAFTPYVELKVNG